MPVDTSVKKRTKLKAASITPPSKKFKQAAVTQQRPISSFFHSPAKSSVKGKEVIVIEDSDSDDYPQSSTQAATAHGGNGNLESSKNCVLQPPEEGQMSSLRYVKEKSGHDLAGTSGFFHEKLNATSNGTVISSLTEGQGSDDGVHYFSRNTKKIAGDELAITSNIITSASKDSAEKIDFDHDPFTFDPSQLAATSWPKGRLPYSILVGVYVQVSSTKSRLAIIRILTKYVQNPSLTWCLCMLNKCHQCHPAVSFICSCILHHQI